MPAPVPGSRPDDEQPADSTPNPQPEGPPGGASGPDRQPSASHAGRDGLPPCGGEADAERVADVGWGGPRGFADGLPAGLDYPALQEGLAACGLLGDTGRDAEAKFAGWLGVVACADPAQAVAVAVEHMGPGPAQAGWLGVAAAGTARLDENGLVGAAAAARQLASWAQACELAAIGQLCARTAAADLKIGLKADGRPTRVSRDVVGQIGRASCRERV